MKVLVTGAAGFLGRSVVDAFLDAGHEVRALVRPTRDVAGRWSASGSVDVVRADLAAAPPDKLDFAFDGVDVLVHLAAAVSGDEARQFASTVVGTERLLDAMSRSACRRVVLCSSFTVYDWDVARGTLSEETPITADLEARGGYTVAKVWQERVARRLSEEHGFALTILRPGFIWGPGNAYPSGITAQFGSVHVVFGFRAAAPFTFVENCADAFVAVAEHPETAGEVFNLVDPDRPRTAAFVREYLARTGTRGRVVVVPYALGLALVGAAQLANRALFGGKGRLPSVLSRPRFVARFKPLGFRADRLEEAIGWRPPIPLAAALNRTFGGTER